MSTQKRSHGIRLKIKRANKHIEDLDVLISDFLDTDFYALGIKHKPEIGQVAYYVTRIDPLPDDIPTIAGDAIHNLRSALDHLAWQLVEAGGGTPGDTTSFPITKTREQYDPAFGKREIAEMPKQAAELLRAIQPYKTTDLTLWHLHKMNIHDKHRLIIPVVSALDRFGLKKPDIWLADLSMSYHMELDAELMHLPADTYAHDHSNIKFGTDITFRDLNIVEGKSVLETLNQMADYVSAMIADFEQFLV